MIEYNGELYRDDRIFVINLTFGKLKDEVKRETKTGEINGKIISSLIHIFF